MFHWIRAEIGETLHPITALYVAFICDEIADCAPAFLWNGKEHAMELRHRFKQTISLSDRLRSFSAELTARASKLRPGLERDALLRRARMADTASHIDEWANSPGLRSPK